MDVLAGIIPLEFVPINTKANRITKKQQENQPQCQQFFIPHGLFYLHTPS